LRRGQIIECTLYTSIDSTVSGQIIAYVGDEPIYDFTHRVVVIPPHAKIIGTYGGSGATIAQGQARFPASFDEIELADRVIPIGPQPGIDRAGTNGLGATVDRHTKGAVEDLLILTAVGELLNRSEQTCSGVSCAQTSSGGSSVGSAVVEAGSKMFGKNGQETPTLHVVEGAQIAVELTQDIALPEWAP
jgi:type IV secretory pathway VirB10-like protein